MNFQALRKKEKLTFISCLKNLCVPGASLPNGATSLIYKFQKSEKLRKFISLIYLNLFRSKRFLVFM